ncbi:MAG: hypothetical protein Devi2KO_27520 [Devosia indica]
MDNVEHLGEVDGILIGGDVAFKGDPDEYEAAQDWIGQLADACGCDLNSVFVVPGNHDVDQRVIRSKVAVQNAQSAIFNAHGNRLAVLTAQLNDEQSGRSLFEPIAAYNDFAARYNCQVYPTDKIFWKQIREFGDGVALRIFGLTSTLLSGQGAPRGERDNESTLYLSPLQTVLDPQEDTVTMVLSHHPPEWLLDRDDVNDKINGRAHIQLFGHKHAGRITREDGYLRVNAGAVNPDEGELGWCPTYNFLDIQVEGEGRTRKIKIVTHILEWQQNPEGYRPRRSPQGADFFTHEIAFPSRNRPASVAAPIRVVADEQPAHGGAAILSDTEAEMGRPDTRNLVIRFWKLNSSQRRSIARSLGLLEASEATLPEPERYGRALIRAGERNLLDELQTQIENEERN